MAGRTPRARDWGLRLGRATRSLARLRPVPAGRPAGAGRHADPRDIDPVEDRWQEDRWHDDRRSDGSIAPERAAAEAHREAAEQRDPKAMPTWLPRAFLLATLTVSAFFVVWWLLGRLRGLIGLILLAQFLAFALEPAVNWLARRGWRRGVATGVTMLSAVAALTAFMVAVGSLLVSQVSTLAARLPQYLDLTVEWVNDTFDSKISVEQIQREVIEPGGPLRTWAERLASNAVDVSTSVFGVIFQLFTVLLFAYYLCADAPRVRRSLCSVLPPARQRDVMRAWEIAVDKTGGYLYSRLLLGLVSGLAHYIVLTMLDVQYAIALALWIGLVSQLIPTVGTYLAAALPLVVALVGDPPDALVLLIFVVVYQQIENYLLQPRITAKTLDLHPAVAFGAVIAGAAVLGPIGALLAIPFTAITQTFVGSYIRRYDIEEHPFHEPVGAPPNPDPDSDSDAEAADAADLAAVETERAAEAPQETVPEKAPADPG